MNLDSLRGWFQFYQEQLEEFSKNLILRFGWYVRRIQLDLSFLDLGDGLMGGAPLKNKDAAGNCAYMDCVDRSHIDVVDMNPMGIRAN